MLTRRTLFLAPLLAMPMIGRARRVMAQEGDQTAELQAAIESAQHGSGLVELGAGQFRVSNLKVSGDVQLVGVPGRTMLRATAGESALSIGKASRVSLEGIGFSAKGVAGDIVAAEDVKVLDVNGCSFAGGGAGLRLRNCGGSIQGNSFAFHQAVGVQSMDARHLRISGNALSDIGNNAIQVWRNDKGEDGTIVAENQIARIASEDGGDGQNGNGINIYKAGQVTVANNRISDCAFSAIRNNSGNASVITGNSISRCDEVGLYVEFAFEGAVVSGNLLEDVAHGISITNFNEGGRLAVCNGNVIRRARGVNAHGEPLGGGIFAEADAVVSNNLIEDAEGTGILLGWGKYGRNLSAQGNTLRKVKRGIAFSSLAPGPFQIANNMVIGAKTGAVLAMDHDKVVGDDLTRDGAKLPRSLALSGNVVRADG